MKKHLTEGELRASLDGELDGSLLTHLEACADCQGQLAELKGTHLRVASRLSFLAPGTEQVPSVRFAWSCFTEKYVKQKETSMLRKWFAFPVVRYGAIAVLALALLMAFPTTRALAGELLNLFRVQQVAVLPIDSTGLEKMTGNEALASQMSELISESTEVTDEPGEPVEVANVDEAKSAAGFNVRLPADQTPSHIYVTDSSAFNLTVDRAKAQAFIEAAGRDDLTLPESVDGAEISVSIPAAVNTAFGTCPDPRTEKPEMQEEDMGKDYADCVVFTQMPSPLVNAPADLDMAQLAQIGLEFSGMSREEAAAFTATVDWTSTLVIPVPRRATSQDVSVDGVTGKLIQRVTDYAPEYALVWVKDGIIYGLSGMGTDTAPAFAIAETLP
ncbi:hypothetical protein ANAEL_00230 [Anaerolineales bacterium]|nr:hypothetical protein ANAEL_00230 [Anaerolineales bacterium]